MPEDELPTRQSRVGPEGDTKTLAAVVRQLYPGLSWNKAKDLCRSGRVRIDDLVVTDESSRVRTGMDLMVSPAAPRRRDTSVSPDDVLYLDHDLIVVRKPPGVATVPFGSDERDTLVQRIQAFLRRQSNGARRPSRSRVRVVQRLDKGTSGILVFARTHAAQVQLQDQFRRHSVLRRYDALASGEVQSSTHDTWLLADRGDGLRGSWKGRGQAPFGARRAVTHIEVKEPLAGATRIACRLETGRQHQIRIHLSEAGHPLVGERVYIREHCGPRIEAARPMLHAAVLGFVHPSSGKPLRFEDPPPPDYQEALARLRFR